jgi:phosphorylcholine metabolism protein LicD
MVDGQMIITSMTIVVIIVAIIQVTYYCCKQHFTDPKTGVMYSTRMSEVDIKNLKKGQVKMTGMLYEFDRICRKYGLSYWCMGGTLVGTLRNAGWVPWDGDLDVAMIDSDYEIFYKVAQKELPKNLWLQDERHDKKHNKTHNKIRDLNSCYDKWIKTPRKHLNGLCLDIFLYKVVGDKLIAHKNENISKHDEVYHYNFIFPLKEMEFENISVYVPNDYKQYSINSWGSYPPRNPPLKDRYTHEGRIIPDKPCSWHKKEYPKLY